MRLLRSFDLKQKYFVTVVKVIKFPFLIQNDAMMRQKVEYIHFNPVKRGYVDKPEHWRYSSARNYLEQPGLLEEVCVRW